MRTTCRGLGSSSLGGFGVAVVVVVVVVVVVDFMYTNRDECGGQREYLKTSLIFPNFSTCIHMPNSSAESKHCKR